MATVAVEVSGVSKRFRLYHEKYSSLKERVIHFGHIPYEDFWALRDINLEIHEGETVGLLGHNGSGKSTLLKCIAGILQPTDGEIRTRGRLAALLELGAGFHPDLTGRENVFMNATLLGIDHREITRKFDEIVAFAELDEFIDNQVKYYSSGMYVRLGFAVAVNMDPDILLVDEVLAVGDESFQRKCLERVRLFQREGRTIVFVSHSADLVRQVCDRAAVLDHGDMVAMGTAGEAIRAFREHLLKKTQAAESVGDLAGDGVVDELPLLTHGESQQAKATGTVAVTGVEVVYPGEHSYLMPGDPLDIVIGYDTKDSRVDDVVFGIAVHDLEGRVVFGWNTAMLQVDIAPIQGIGEVRFSFPHIPLLDGDYPITVGVHTKDEGTVYDWKDQEHRFEVMNQGLSAGLVWVPATVSVSTTVFVSTTRSTKQPSIDESEEEQNELLAKEG